MARRSFSKKDRARIFAALQEKTIPEPNSGCLIWLGASKAKGYGHLYAGGRYIGAHRASYIIHCGEIPHGMVVMHKCDTPSCVNPLHLTIGTTRENIHDCIGKNRARRGRFIGEKHPHAKLNEKAVAEILGAPRIYGYRIALAEKFGVSPGTISKVLYGATWVAR